MSSLQKHQFPMLLELFVLVIDLKNLKGYVRQGQRTDTERTDRQNPNLGTFLFLSESMYRTVINNMIFTNLLWSKKSTNRYWHPLLPQTHPHNTYKSSYMQRSSSTWTNIDSKHHVFSIILFCKSLQWLCWMDNNAEQHVWCPERLFYKNQSLTTSEKKNLIVFISDKNICLSACIYLLFLNRRPFQIVK